MEAQDAVPTDKEVTMDKFILLTYTCIGQDGYRHSGHAWFESEEAMRAFVAESEAEELEVDLAVEILSYREIEV